MPRTTHRELNYQILHLASWPARRHLLEQSGEDITRICALLARRPSVGILIPVMLNLSPQLTFSLLRKLYADGNIYPAVVPDLNELEQAQSAPPASEESVAATSFIAKIWQHLIEKT